VNAIRSGYDSSTAILGIDAWRSEHGQALAPRTDELSVEEPLEIRVAGETLAVTMRTPGHDRELAAGFLLAERVIRARGDLGGIAHCGRLGHEGYGNVLEVTPAPGVVLELDFLAGARRGTLTTSACGVCGRRMVDDLVSTLTAPAAACFERAFIASLPAGLRARQPNFDRTGGLHAAGIASTSEGFLVVREDVGRHNAVDKAVGRLLLDDRLPARGAALVVSGRTSFEIVQKAVAAGIPAVVGISAPSSLAVSTAVRFGVLLCGFARGGAFNVYAGAERLATSALVCT
jgi:FdhD protein